MAKSRAGKAVSSRNALRHGLTSVEPVIAGMERKEDWRAHCGGVIASLAPEGYLELVLAERVANLTWRINRVTRYEVAVAEEQVGRTEEDRAIADAYLFGADAVLAQADGKRDDLPVPTPEELANDRERRIIPWRDALDKIMRYESHLHRQWMQTLHELEAMQARRLGLPANLYRLDISAPPGSVPQRSGAASATI